MEYLVRSIQFAKGVVWPYEAPFKNLLLFAPMGLFLLSLPLLLGELPSIARSRVVTLDIGGRKTVYPTSAPNVKEALRGHGITAAPADLIDPHPETRMEGVTSITYKKAYPKFVEDGGKVRKLFSGSDKPDEIITGAGLKTMPEDLISMETVHYDFLKHGGIGRKVIIKRAPRITLKADGKETLMASWAPTVGAMLAEKGMSLKNLDYSIPGPDERVTNNMALFIKRVKEEDRVERIVSEPKTVLSFDPSLDFWGKRVDQAAQQGIVDKKFHVRFEDGELILKKMLGSTPIQQLKNLVISRGARFGDRATAYCLGASYCNGLTAARGSGLRDVPLGTKLRVTNVTSGSPYKGRSVDVVINDNCGCGSGAMIDLAYAAFFKISDFARPMPKIMVQVVSP